MEQQIQMLLHIFSFRETLTGIKLCKLIPTFLYWGTELKCKLKVSVVREIESEAQAGLWLEYLKEI